MIDEIQKISPTSKVGKAMLKPPSKAEKAAIAAAARRKVKIVQPPDLGDLGDAEVEVPVQRMVRRVTREPTREATRRNTRDKVEVVGRNGEKLSRRREMGIDPFAIDPRIIPDGWEYQWNTISVTGNKDVVADMNLLMMENGWRAVPASRHPGRYMPTGYEGAIIRGGLQLEERPKALSDEARAEDQRAAHQLVSDRNEALQLTSMRSRMADGFEMGGKYRGTGGNVRISIDQAGDIPAAKYEVEE